MTARHAVSFEAAALGYGGRPVLSGLDFKVPAGAFVGLLGANGSGKTTIIRAVLGLSPCLAGRVETQGSSGAPPRFGYVPQKERLDPGYPLTARDVAAMGAWRTWSLPGVGARGRAGLVESCLRLCGALEFASARFGDLSGGQRQRALLARALVSEPDILVLDEPLAGIDSPTRQALLELLAGLRRDGSPTVLMASHRIQAEGELFTHAVWVEGGRALFGPAAEVLADERVSNAFRGGL